MQTRSKSLSSWLTLACLVGSVGTASAQLGIPRFTVDCGGGSSTGGAFAMGGTAGQPDAGRMSGGSFMLAGGFWVGGGGVPAGVEGAHQEDGTDSGSPPLVFRLFPASPNPLAESMVLAFELPESRFVRAEIYDVAGHLVRVLANEQVATGRSQRVWDRRDQQGLRVPAGIYFIRFNAGSNQNRQKIVVLS